MAKTFRWDDKQDPRKTTQKAKQDQRQQGRKEKAIFAECNRMNNFNLQLQQTIQDKRYSVNLEYCGQSKAKYVLRFCNDMIKTCDTLNDAIFEAIFHQDDRELKLLAI